MHRLIFTAEDIFEMDRLFCILYSLLIKPVFAPLQKRLEDRGVIVFILGDNARMTPHDGKKIVIAD